MSALHVRRRILLAIALLVSAGVISFIGWRTNASSSIRISLLATAALLVVIAFVQWMVVLRRLIVRTSPRRKIGDDACRRCGYVLRGLAMKRCPECGALLGFTKSAEELGIEDAELRG